MNYKIFGCKVNKFFANKWLVYFRKYKPEFFEWKNILIASCVVTDRAKKKWIKEVLNWLKSGYKVFLTGCGAFQKWEVMDYDKFFSIYPELKDYKLNLVLLWEDPQNQYDVKIDLSDLIENQIYTKKFIVVQSWCDTWCTFCLTIYKRWQHRSRSLKEIIDEIKKFEDMWWKEVVLTGVNLAAWWASATNKPKESKFSYLLEQILNNTKIPRIRISSLWPEFLDKRFFEIVSDTRFLPHFHFSIQHFSDKILSLMNRNYNFALLEKVLTNIKNLKRADKDILSIGADIIVWFPWETKEDFNFLLKSIQQFGITKVHSFPFSPHLKWETVPAWKFPNQVPILEKKQREKQLVELSENLRKQWINSMKWKKFEVLIEENKDWKWYWWTQNYIQISLEWEYKKGDIVEVVL